MPGLREEQGHRPPVAVAPARALPYVLVVLVAVVAYGPSFAVPFQFDDVPNIVEDRAIHVEGLDPAALGRAMATGPRPLARLTFALNHAAAGLDVRAWHAVNLAFHVASAWCVLALAALLLRLAIPALDDARRRRVAVLTALVFVAHPAQTQAVTYVVQRMASMGAFFGFVAALLYFRARTAPRGRALAGVAAAAAFVLAFLSKENFVALPAVLLATDVLLLGAWRERIRRHRAAAVAGIAAAAAFAALLWIRFAPVIAAESARYPYTTAERLLTQPRAVWHYLSLLALPLPGRLQVDYDFPVSRTLLDPATTLLAIVALVAVVALAWRLRGRWPLLAFATLWFLGNLVVESSVLPIDLVFEQRIYFPSFGPILAACAALEVAVGVVPWRAWAAAAPVVALLAAGTFARNVTWQDPLALQRAAVAAGNETTRALLTIGSQYEERGDLVRAQEAFRRVLDKHPSSSVALENLGVLAMRGGDAAGAESWFRRARSASPGSARTRALLADAILAQGRTEEGERELRDALRIDPACPGALVALGVLAARSGDLATARERFSRAVEADPRHVGARLNRARTSLAAGDVQDALRDLRAAREADPADLESLQLLGETLVQAGRAAEAVTAYSDAVRARPAQPGLHFGLGNLLVGEGRLAEAEREYLAEVAIAPHAGAYNNLGSIYAASDPARARDAYRRALAADPGNADAAANLRLLAGGR